MIDSRRGSITQQDLYKTILVIIAKLVFRKDLHLYPAIGMFEYLCHHTLASRENKHYNFCQDDTQKYLSFWFIFCCSLIGLIIFHINCWAVTFVAVFVYVKYLPMHSVYLLIFLLRYYIFYFYQFTEPFFSYTLRVLNHLPCIIKDSLLGYVLFFC